MNKYVLLFTKPVVLIALMMSQSAPSWGMELNAGQRIPMAPANQQTRQDIKGAIAVLKDKTEEAIKITQEIEKAKKAGFSEIAIDLMIGSLLDVVRVIIIIFAFVFLEFAVIFGLPFLLVVYRSLTKDIKKDSPEAVIKQNLTLEHALPYILSGKLSPNILNISLAYSEREDSLIAALKQGNNLSKLEKGLKGMLFLLNRALRYTIGASKLLITIVLLAFATLSAAVASIPLIPSVALYQLFKAITFLRRKIKVEPSRI